MKSSEEIEDLEVTRAELARCLGLSGSRIAQLVEEKVIPPPETHGKYKLAASTRAYCRYQRDVGGERSKGAAEFSSARTEWMKSRARKAALEEKALSDEYIPVAVMTEAWCAIGSVMRQKYLSVPSRLAAQHATLDTPQRLFDCALTLINDALEELEKFDPSTLDIFEKPDEQAAE
jgi:phage terminase Nu1 subunit (DNA packaging protein)